MSKVNEMFGLYINGPEFPDLDKLLGNVCEKC